MANDESCVRTVNATWALKYAVLGALVLGLPATVAIAGDVEPAATAPTAATTTDDDPLEGVNRFTSGLNKALRDAVINPLVDGYQAVTPEPVQKSVTNVFSNLTEPVTAVSSLLQGDSDNAGAATNRFLINTTIGLGGINDRATGMGIKQRREDLGQAMASNGVAPGPHIVLPLLGPSNLRDATGDILTGLASPVPIAVQAAGNGVTYSNYQDDINAIGNNSVDPYVAEREAYDQHRSYQIKNGMEPDGNFPTFAEDAGQSIAAAPK